jgi:ribonuclease VapC
MQQLFDGLGFEVITVTAVAAHRIAGHFAKWGKGVHPAGLNFGDCFAFEVAREHDCPLLFVGSDFEKSDVRSALVEPS